MKKIKFKRTPFRQDSVRKMWKMWKMWITSYHKKRDDVFMLTEGILP